MRFLKFLLSLLDPQAIAMWLFFWFAPTAVVSIFIGIGIFKAIVKFLHRNDVVETPPPAWQFPTEPIRTIICFGTDRPRSSSCGGSRGSVAAVNEAIAESDGDPRQQRPKLMQSLLQSTRQSLQPCGRNGRNNENGHP